MTVTSVAKIRNFHQKFAKFNSDSTQICRNSILKIQLHKPCRSRKMQENRTTLAIGGVDSAEKGLSEVWPVDPNTPRSNEQLYPPMSRRPPLSSYCAQNPACVSAAAVRLSVTVTHHRIIEPEPSADEHHGFQLSNYEHSPVQY